MGYIVNPGNGAFKSKISYDSPDSSYVDKTMLIAYINSSLNTDNKETVFTRPRRFGKTTDALMLAAYYSVGCDSAELFSSFLISKEMSHFRHLNQYNVLLIDMSEYAGRQLVESGRSLLKLKLDVLEELKEEFTEIDFDVYRDYDPDFLSISDMVGIAAKKTGRQFFVIIDEWDILIREAEKNPGMKMDYLYLLRELFKGTGSQYYLAGAYMTGILPIVRYNTQSALSDFREFTMLSPKQLAPFIGFTDREVKEFCETYRLDYEKMSEWYDGYHLDQFNRQTRQVEVCHVYCPRSVMGVIETGVFRSYWGSTAAYESLNEYINLDLSGVREAIVQLLGGQRIHVDTEKFSNNPDQILSRDHVLTMLIHLGFLGYRQEDSTVYIPNYEVKKFFINSLEESRYDDLRNAVKKSEELLAATIAMDEARVAEIVDDVHNSSLAHLKYNSEDSLRYVILLAYIASLNSYTSFQELASGKGFCDILFYPYPGIQKPALLVELKWDKPAEEAISQIKEKNYQAKLKDMHYDGDVLFVGITYDPAGKTHACKIQKQPL